MPLLSFNQHKNGDSNRGRSPEDLPRPVSRETTQVGSAWEDTNNKIEKEEFNIQVYLVVCFS